MEILRNIDSLDKIAYLWNQIQKYGNMIKFSHTIFALPFALSAVILAHRYNSIRFLDLLWVLVAMVSARSGAMGFNRIADANIDEKNPRTSNRAIPAGTLSKFSAITFVIISAIIFIFSAAMLGSLCFYLSFPVLIFLFAYSYTKRFTWLCHLYLGFAISLAPIGAWVALTNTITFSIILLSLALMTYIAGFDILYSCQDTDFDKKQGLFSMPANLGVKKSLFISSIIHGFSFLFFYMIYLAFDLGVIYLAAVVIIGIALIIEHKLVKPDDLSNVNIAFFHMNSIVSVTLFLGIMADELFL